MPVGRLWFRLLGWVRGGDGGGYEGPRTLVIREREVIVWRREGLGPRMGWGWSCWIGGEGKRWERRRDLREDDDGLWLW